jgi:hypothetical protein
VRYKISSIFAYRKIFKAIELNKYKSAEEMERDQNMKRALFAAFCILALCSLLLVNTRAVKAATASGYTRTDWYLQVTKTIDGIWTTTGEWTDGEPTVINQNLTFRSVWENPSDVYTNFVVEFFSDNTTDAGDYWEMCFDFNNGGGANLGGSGRYYRVYIEGHNNLTVYQGGASGWTELSSAKSDIQWANAISASPNSSIPHWILEMRILKSAGTNMIDATFGLRVAAYDANTSTLVSWPPNANRDVPDQWGTQTYETGAFPETLTITAVVLLSSVAVVVSFHFLRKQPKTESYSSGKREK